MSVLMGDVSESDFNQNFLNLCSVRETPFEVIRCDLQMTSVGNFPGNKSISQDGGKYREILGNIGKYWEIWKVCSYLVI